MNRTRAATYTGRFLLILASLALIGADREVLIA